MIILANFDVSSKNINPNFPYTGTWFDLMDTSGNTAIEVTNTTEIVTVPPGEFRIYGNKPSTLSLDNVALQNIELYPNPVSTVFQLNTEVKNF